MYSGPGCRCCSLTESLMLTYLPLKKSSWKNKAGWFPETIAEKKITQTDNLQAPELSGKHHIGPRSNSFSQLHIFFSFYWDTQVKDLNSHKPAILHRFWRSAAVNPTNIASYIKYCTEGVLETKRFGGSTLRNIPAVILSSLFSNYPFQLSFWIEKFIFRTNILSFIQS